MSNHDDAEYGYDTAGPDLDKYIIKTLTEINADKDIEIARLRSAVQQFADPSNWSDQVACLQWIGKRHAIEFADSVLTALSPSPITSCEGHLHDDEDIHFFLG